MFWGGRNPPGGIDLNPGGKLNVEGYLFKGVKLGGGGGLYVGKEMCGEGASKLLLFG